MSWRTSGAFKLERDYWLSHFYQPIGGRRPTGPLDYAKDCVPIPMPANQMPITGVPCWAWRGALNPGGYALLSRRVAHAISYELSRGRAVKDGERILHLCNRPYCVQPGHLVSATPKDAAAFLSQQDYQWETTQEWSDDADRYARRDLELYTPPAAPDETYYPITCPHFYPRGALAGCGNCRYHPPSEYRPHCSHYYVHGQPWPCRCQEEPYCSCHIQYLLRNGVESGKTYGCDQCKHLVVDAEYTTGIKPQGHETDCPEYPWPHPNLDARR